MSLVGYFEHYGAFLDPHKSSKVLLALPCVFFLVTVYETSQKFSNQFEWNTYVLCFGSVRVSNSFFEWSIIASDCWFQVISKMSQILVLVKPTTITNHVCKIVIGHSTLVISRLFGLSFILQTHNVIEVTWIKLHLNFYRMFKVTTLIWPFLVT